MSGEPLVGDIDVTRLASKAASDVFALMAVVQADLAKIGIAKIRENAQQNYKFRGIDDVYNVVAPMFAEHGLLMLPRIMERTVTDRISGNNKALFYVVVKAEYDFVSVADGSRCTVGPFYGEAMDSADKATNKAMSAAHKYAIFQTFCIPVQGSPDADADDHDVRAELTPEQAASLAKLTAAAKEGIRALEEAWGAAGKANRLALAAHLDGLKETAAQAGNAA